MNATSEMLRRRAQETKDKVFEDGNNLNGGAIYEVEITALKCAPGFSRKLNRKTTFFTPEFKIVAMQPVLSAEAIKALPITRQPNQPGSNASIPLPIEFDWASGKMLKMLSVLTGEAVDEFGKEFCASACEASKQGQTCAHEKSSLVEELTNDKQPLRGARLMIEATDKPLSGKDGSDPKDLRTRHKFFHTPETKAATEKVLGGGA